MSGPSYFSHGEHEWHESEQGKDAPVLVLLHGWGFHSGVWEIFIPFLMPSFNVLCVDLPEQAGESEFNHNHNHNHDFCQKMAGIELKSKKIVATQSQLKSGFSHHNNFFEKLAVLVREKSAESNGEIIWLGWSLGGLYAIEMASRYPDLSQGLCLIASTPRFLQNENWPYAIEPEVFEQFSASLNDSVEKTLDKFFRFQCIGSNSARTDIRYLQKIVAERPLPEKIQLQQGLKELSLSDLREQFESLSLPVLMLLGENDSLIPSGTKDAIQTLKKSAEINVIPDTTHVPFVTKPALCAAYLQKFYAQFFRSPKVEELLSVERDGEVQSGMDNSRVQRSEFLQ